MERGTRRVSTSTSGSRAGAVIFAALSGETVRRFPRRRSEFLLRIGRTKPYRLTERVLFGQGFRVN